MKISLELIKEFLSSGRKCPRTFAELPNPEKRNAQNALSRAAKQYTMQDDVLYRMKGASQMKVLFSREEIEDVLRGIHGEGQNGPHMGLKKTQQNVAERFFWQGITADVQFWVTTCPQCQSTQRIKTIVPVLRPIFAKGPWEFVGIDLIGPFKETSRGYKYVLTGTCLFSKWVEAEPIPDKSAASVVAGLSKWMHRWGAPVRILTDQGKEFNNKKINDEIFEKFNVRQLVSSAYHPQTNGQDERTNGSIKRHISKVTFSSFRWIFQAINVDGDHWVLLAASVPQQRVALLDSLFKENSHIRLKKWKEFMALRSQVHEPHLSYWKETQVLKKKQQTDGHSCGPFVMLNALALMRGIPLDKVTQEHALAMRAYVFHKLMSYGILLS